LFKISSFSFKVVGNLNWSKVTNLATEFLQIAELFPIFEEKYKIKWKSK